MNNLIKEMALIAILMLYLGICCGSEYAEIRSPVGDVNVGSTYEWGPKKANSEFYGFYYDINDDFGTESMIMTISEANALDGSSRPTGIQYTTEKQLKRFQQRDWGSYDCIGYLGEKYFAGYIENQDPDAASYLASESERKNPLADDMLTRVLIDDDTEKTVAAGSSIDLMEGYDLKVTSIDMNSKKIYLELHKDGAPVDSKVVVPETENPKVSDRTYYYMKDSGDLKGLITIAVHFKNAFHGSDRDLASVDGVFQLSEKPESVKTGTKYDRMSISKVDPTYGMITMENLDNTIILGKNMDLGLMRGIRLRTEDNNVADDTRPLRFFIYKKITEPGSYQINGRAEDIIDGRQVSWNYDNFPGFYYDLDNDLGREELEIRISGDLEDGVLNQGDVVYKATAQSTNFDFADWGKYYVIGFLGEKYFAGYVTTPDEDHTRFLWGASDNSNLISYDVLSRVLIDKEEDANTTLGAGSTYPLKEDYELRIREIDVEGKKVLVALAKNGREIDQSVVEFAVNPTYRYEKNLDGADKLVIIAVRFKELLSSQEIDLAELKAIWQISEDVIKVGSGTDLSRVMAIDSVNSNEGQMAIEARNVESSMRLGKDKTIALMADYYIKTADQEEVSQSNPLRFFVFKGVTVADNGGFVTPQEQLMDEAYPLPPEEKPAEKKTPGFLASFAGVCMLIALRIVKRTDTRRRERKSDRDLRAA
jgi:S-layer protein (TIGR01567 family)